MSETPASDSLSLEGRVAVVTGSGSGLGAAEAIELARSGAAAVVVNDIKTSEHTDAVIAAIEEAGARAELVLGDVSEAATADEMISAAEKLGGLDIVVNNAGITRDKMLFNMSDEEFDQVIDTNLAGAFRCARRAVTGMIRKRKGRIVLISSVVGLYGSPGQANYAASKAGLVGIARSMTRELGARGITANVVAPGYVDTDMTAAMEDRYIEMAKQAIPLGRTGKPEDVAAAISFLASDEGGYISGAVLPVDGGMGMGH